MAPPKQDESQRRCIKMRQDKLLQERELNGNIISCRKGKLSFQAEYQKIHASEPLIWKYKGTEKMGNIALEQVVADVISPHGLVRRDILLSGGLNRLCFLKIGKAGQESDPTPTSYKADLVWPLNLNHEAGHKQLSRGLESSYGALPSDITCIKAFRKHSLSTDDITSKKVLITTRGSDNSPGSVFLLNLSVPFYFDGTPMIENGLIRFAEYKHTLWTVDCDPEGICALFGTHNGAKLLNMETRASSWVFRSMSDVLCLQLDQSGKSVLCGLRSGGIFNVDIREKPITQGTHILMPSTVCCLRSLICDQYFLASSMDGSIRLYDHRLTDRGPVQSYEGNVNSQTDIQFGVDPSEKVVMSGGEDCYLRLWNIMSGELLFKERFTNSTPSAVCWPRNREFNSLYIRDFVISNRWRPRLQRLLAGPLLGCMAGFSRRDLLHGLAVSDCSALGEPTLHVSTNTCKRCLPSWYKISIPIAMRKIAIVQGIVKNEYGLMCGSNQPRHTLHAWAVRTCVAPSIKKH